MSMGPWESYRAGTWLIDECQIAFFMSCLMLRVCTHLFCRYFQCHLSYHQQFVCYLGYHGYKFCAPLSSLFEKRKPNKMVDKIMEILSLQTCRLYAVHI